jgi:hypothetical protein
MRGLVIALDAGIGEAPQFLPADGDWRWRRARTIPSAAPAETRAGSVARGTSCRCGRAGAARPPHGARLSLCPSLPPCGLAP